MPTAACFAREPATQPPWLGSAGAERRSAGEGKLAALPHEATLERLPPLDVDASLRAERQPDCGGLPHGSRGDGWLEPAEAQTDLGQAAARRAGMAPVFLPAPCRPTSVGLLGVPCTPDSDLLLCVGVGTSPWLARRGLGTMPSMPTGAEADESDARLVRSGRLQRGCAMTALPSRGRESACGKLGARGLPEQYTGWLVRLPWAKRTS